MLHQTYFGNKCGCLYQFESSLVSYHFAQLPKYHLNYHGHNSAATDSPKGPYFWSNPHLLCYKTLHGQKHLYGPLDPGNA